MRKILVVDDNLDYLELLASVLGKYFEVYEATGVKDALRVLGDKEKEIEAICSDYNMRDEPYGIWGCEQGRAGGYRNRPH